MAGGFRIIAAFKGDLQKIIDDELKASRRAVTRGIKTAGEGLKQELRAETVSGGLGRRLANTWRLNTYPKGGRDSRKAAALVFSKAPEIMSAHAADTVIRPDGGRMLAIPTENAPKRGSDGTKISPSNWPSGRFGPLRMVKTPRSLLLVADGLKVTRSGRISRIKSNKATKKLGARSNLDGRVSVVMFVLVPQVRLRKRFDMKAAGDKWHRRVPQLIAQNWPDK